MEQRGNIDVCGRFSLFADLTDLEERFDFAAVGLAYTPNYNIAPTQNILALFNDRGSRQAGYMHWGLIPPWSKDTAFASRMINARAETLAEKPSFRTAFQRRRCLILADGFYEWQRRDTGKRPMRIELATKEAFAFAGIWETWKNPEGNRIRSCAIITAPAHASIKPIHDRMPVILNRERERLWMSPEPGNPEHLRNMLLSGQVAPLETYEVAPLVNVPLNNGSELLKRSGTS